MNSLMNFQYEGQQVRTILQNGAPWFVAKDVCECLELDDVRRAVERLDEDERSLTPVIDSMKRNQEMYIINEPGLYNLIFGSRKQEARQFKRWVTHEVLPAIRKTGRYENEQNQIVNDDPVINELANRLTLAEIAAIFEARSRSETGQIGNKIEIYAKGPQTTRRSHSKVERLNAKEEVQRLIKEGHTYNEIVEILKENGIAISKSSIGRFGQKYLKEYSRQEVILPSGLRVIQENSKLI